MAAAVDIEPWKAKRFGVTWQPAVIAIDAKGRTAGIDQATTASVPGTGSRRSSLARAMLLLGLDWACSDRASNWFAW